MAPRAARGWAALLTAVTLVTGCAKVAKTRQFIEWAAHDYYEDAATAVLLVAPSADSLTLECQGDGLYLRYGLEDTPACSEFFCRVIWARTDGGKWLEYAAHHFPNGGYVPNKNSASRRDGAAAEVLLEQMLNASNVEFQHPLTGEPVGFAIGEAHRAELSAIAAECG